MVGFLLREQGFCWIKEAKVRFWFSLFLVFGVGDDMGLLMVLDLWIYWYCCWIIEMLMVLFMVYCCRNSKDQRNAHSPTKEKKKK